jgi:hypothetical protein
LLSSDRRTYRRDGGNGKDDGKCNSDGNGTADVTEAINSLSEVISNIKLVIADN